MFKIPDWEDDVPKTSAHFTKNSKAKKEPRVQKSPANKTKNVKENKNRLPKHNKNKLTQFSRKQNVRIEKSQKKNVVQSNFRIQNRGFGSNENTTNKYPKQMRTNGNIGKGSLLKQQKNEKNSQMMNIRLQNKMTKANGSINNSSPNKKERNKLKNNINLNTKTTKPINRSQKTENKNLVSSHFNKMNKNIEENDLSNERDGNISNNEDKGNKRKRKMNESDRLEIQNFDSDKLDEVVINAKKKKLNESLKNDDDEEELFNEDKIKHKTNPNCRKEKFRKLPEKKNPNFKKEKFRKLLELNSKRNHIEVKGNKLRERMMERLKAAQFRYLNEKLYTSSGSEAQQLFRSDPAAFQTYHQGYQQQVKKWPVNPLDIIVKKIAKMPKTHTIADMGCGEAALSKRVPHKVRSFDLVASAPGVEACDMAHTPLLAESVDVAVYSLALMGTDLTQYLIEANRVLKMGGHLLIAEVESRFEDADAFTKEVMRLGFKLKNLDKSHKVFFFMEFLKIREPPAKKSKLPAITLKPCLYKRR